MRIRKSKNGITVKAYSGTTGILLAFNIDDALKEDFLGFAIERVGNGKTAWLQGMLSFPNELVKEYKAVDSNIAPIQKFRWSDYTVHDGSEYIYRIFGMHGSPSQLKSIEGPEIKINTQPLDTGKHQILFNRAVAASQAYTTKFGQTKPSTDLTTVSKEEAKKIMDARAWLSRGLKEKIQSFMSLAKDTTHRLEVCIYEFELKEYVDALQKALNRGVEVEVVYHAKKSDTQTLVNEEIIAPLPSSIRTPRNTSKIFHHKFIVLSEKQPDGSWKPLKVLSGSTNWTFNGVYQQGNVGHVMEDETIAKTYHDLFTFIKAHPDQTQKVNNVKPFNNANSGISLTKPISVSFSPRTGKDDLLAIIAAIDGAKESMILCSAFDIYEDIITAIQKQPKIVKYGLQNSSSKITGFHRDFNSSFVVPAFLAKGIEGEFKTEITARRKGEGNIFIHLKTIVLDFSTNDPTVITGSHNFSESASEGNDENLICIRGDTDVADVYTIEMFRLYDHYRFRFNQKEAASLGKSTSIKPLAVDNSWLTDYFTPGMLEQRERILFSQ